MFKVKFKLPLLITSVAIILTVILTWPFVLNIGSYYSDQGDYPLAGSVLAYNADSILSGRIFNPKEYWQGYQFYSQPYSLAFINHSFVPSLIFAPIYWVTSSLPFSVNSLAFLTYVLSFVASFYTIRYFLHLGGVQGHLRGVTLAALVGAFIFTFNPLTSTRFPHHLDILNKYFLPLVFLFAYKLLDKPTWKNSFWFFVFFTLNALSVNYYQIFSIVLLPLAALAFLVPRAIKRDWGYLGSLGRVSLVGLVFLPILLYFNLPYLELSNKEGAGRTVNEAVFFSARVNDFFGTDPDSLIYGGWTKNLEDSRSPKDDRGILNYEEHTLALLILPTILFILGWRVFLKEKFRKSFFLILLGVTFILMFGPYFVGFSDEGTAYLPFYFIYQVLPIMQGIRAPTRFEFIFYIPFALIAAYGVRWLMEKKGLPAGRQGFWVFGVLGVILILENLGLNSFELRSNMLPQANNLKEELAFLKDKVTFHLPVFGLEDADIFGRTSAYLNWQTVTREKLFQGNSAYLPPDQMALILEVRQNFAESVKKLAILGVEYVVVHKDLMDTAPKVGKVVHEDPNLLVLDISGLGAGAPLCSMDDLQISIALAQDLDLNLSYALTLQNAKDCYLVSTFDSRYQQTEVTIDGQKKVAHYRLPLLINPKEQVILSEINRELKIK